MRPEIDSAGEVLPIQRVWFQFIVTYPSSSGSNKWMCELCQFLSPASDGLADRASILVVSMIAIDINERNREMPETQ